jgi:hypothetical protein
VQRCVADCAALASWTARQKGEAAEAVATSRARSEEMYQAMYQEWQQQVRA